MMKVVSIVGARPQFVKAAAISRRLRQHHTEILVHTGQHYDSNMSALFFEELDIPTPEINLEVGSGSHGHQTGQMLMGIEKILQQEQADWVVVYGDTNSTLAGALAASKLNIPLAHVEAGLRSFNRRMAEEINRVLTDHVSTLLFCPSQTAVKNLASEGIAAGVHLVGDVMADVFLLASERSRKRSQIVRQLGLVQGHYIVTTVHRAENTDEPARLLAILRALNRLELPVVFPVHPRTEKALDGLSFSPADHVRLIEPVGPLDMVTLELNAHAIVTDSGGIQKEAYWAGVPCVTLRDETEWPETVDAGWNVLVGADEEKIVKTVSWISKPTERPPLYGEGHTGVRCVELLETTDAG